MKNSPWICVSILAALAVLGCGRSPATATADAAEAADAAASMVKVSTYGKGAFTDLVVTRDGTIHVVFSDQPAYNKPMYLYHRSSANGGKTWTEPKNLSDDESGIPASFVRLTEDGKGRIYCVWKYTNKSLDGPGGYGEGKLVFRCLEGGNWSNRKPISEDKLPGFSWFVAVDPNGVAHIVWSQMAKDGAAAQGWASAAYANLVRQASFDGATLGPVKDVIVPKPLLTKEQQEEMKKAGKYPQYEDTVPRKTGFINLRGYVDATGTAHFVAEDPGVSEGPAEKRNDKRIVHWDGKKLTQLYAYERYQTYNIFMNPPLLAVDAAGKEFLIRAPEKSEKACVRAYPITDGELGDPVDIIAPKTGPGLIPNWQATQLAGGRIALTVAFSEKGGYSPDDLDLYLCLFDGKGNWSAPRQLTNNSAKKSSFSKETGGLNSVGMVTSYEPRFAATVIGKNGAPALAIVNVESSIVGMNSPGVTSSGRTVVVSSGGRVEDPFVFFLQL